MNYLTFDTNFGIYQEVGLTDMTGKNICDILEEIKGEEFRIFEKNLKKYFPESIRTYGTLCTASEGLHLPQSKVFGRIGDGDELTVIVEDFYTAGSDPLATTVVLYSSDPENFADIIQKTNVFDWSKRFFFSGIPFPLCEKLKEFLATKNANIKSYMVDVYLLSDVNNLVPETQIPDEVYLGPLKAEHAENVNNVWKFGHPALEKELKARIEKFVSAGVYLKHNGALISWIIQQPYGSIGSLYTLPEHRGRGYAKLVISYAAKRLIERNLEVFCGIEDYNKESKIVFEKLGFVKQFQQSFISYVPKIE